MRQSVHALPCLATTVVLGMHAVQAVMLSGLTGVVGMFPRSVCFHYSSGKCLWGAKGRIRHAMPSAAFSGFCKASAAFWSSIHM